MPLSFSLIWLVLTGWAVEIARKTSYAVRGEPRRGGNAVRGGEALSFDIQHDSAASVVRPWAVLWQCCTGAADSRSRTHETTWRPRASPRSTQYKCRMCNFLSIWHLHGLSELFMCVDDLSRLALQRCDFLLVQRGQLGLRYTYIVQPWNIKLTKWIICVTFWIVGFFNCQGIGGRHLYEPGGTKCACGSMAAWSPDCPPGWGRTKNALTEHL